MVSGAGTTHRFHDAVHQMKEQTRWNRAEFALDQVSPEYRTHYRQRRQAWREDLRIADAEILHMKLTNDEARSTLAVRWHPKNSTTLHNTVIEQRWEQKDGSFLLKEETTLSGKSLFRATIAQRTSSR